MHMSCIGRPGWSVSPSRADRLCDLILHEYKFVSRRPIRPPSLSLFFSLSLCPICAIPFRTIGVRQAACSIAGEEGGRGDRDATLMVAPAGVGDRLAALVADIGSISWSFGRITWRGYFESYGPCCYFCSWEGISEYFHEEDSFRGQCNL